MSKVLQKPALPQLIICAQDHYVTSKVDLQTIPEGLRIGVKRMVIESSPGASPHLTVQLAPNLAACHGARGRKGGADPGAKAAAGSQGRILPPPELRVDTLLISTWKPPNPVLISFLGGRKNPLLLASRLCLRFIFGGLTFLRALSGSVFRTLFASAPRNPRNRM